MARILLVDDYPDALDVWTLYLQMHGFDVVTALDGLTALDVAQREHPDLAVLDLELPGITGVELARRLRAGSSCASIPLIAVTGHSLPARLDEAHQAGFDLVRVKPCDGDQLCSDIRRLLGEHASKSGVTLSGLKG